MNQFTLFLLLFSVDLASLQETLRFGAVDVKPFALVKRQCLYKRVQGTDSEEECKAMPYEGLCIDLMKLVAAELNVTYTIDMRDGIGYRDSNGTWNGLIAAVDSEIVDVACAPIFSTPERATVLDFSPPFFESGLSVMIRKFSWKGMLQPVDPYTQNTWIAIGGVEIFSILTIIGLYFRMRQSEKTSSELSAYIFAFFFLIWVICTFTLAAFIFLYVHKATEYNDKVEPVRVFRTVEDLLDQSETKIGIPSGGMSQHLLKTSNDTLSRKLWEMIDSNGNSSFVSGYASGIERVRMSDREFAFLLDDAANEYENGRRPCDTMKIGEKFITYYFAVTTKKGSPLSEKVRSAMESIKLTDALEKLRLKWFVDNSQCKSTSSSFTRHDSEERGIYVVFGLAGAIVVSLIASLCAIFVERRSIQYTCGAEGTPPITD